MTKLLEQYRTMAALGGNFRGLSLLVHADEIGAVVKQHGARSLLDYGSGAGDAYRAPHQVHRQWGVNRAFIRLYDPSFKRIDHPVADRYDGVICSDVLEHIPEPLVDALISALFGYARKFVWASVCCRPAKKCFPDGTNLHVTLHPIEWWRERFEARTNGLPFYLTETP